MSEQRQPPARKAIGLLVKLKHPDLETFAQEYATNLSPGGMFIRSRQPQPVGTLLNFEVQIAGGVRVMRGQAEVRWIRQVNDPAGPPGMGLQFKKLDAPTRALIERMLQHKKQRLAAKAPQPRPIAKPAAIVPPPPPEIPLEVEPKGSGVEIPLEVEPKGSGVEIPLEVEPKGSGIEIPIEVDLSDDAGVEIPLDELVASTPAPETAQPLSYEERMAAAARELAMLEPPPPPQSSAEPLDLDAIFALENPAPRPPPASAPEPATPPPPPEPAQPVVRQQSTPPPPPEPSQPVVLHQPAPTPPPPPTAATGRDAVFLDPPAQVEGVGPIIGIDLGTTNTCVGIFQNGKPTVIHSRDGYNTIPSIVALTPQNKLLVSHRAKNQLLMNPQQTIFGAKRLVGRAYDSPVVEQVREHMHYEICPDAYGRAAVRLGKHVLSLEEVQALILKECKDVASQHLGAEVQRAVITVPAYYSEPQREAVRKAGSIAGLKVERILNEPTAAALAYGLNRSLTKKVLVYDLGGGTFDATLLRIDDNVFEVLATGGDTFLGGVDFDNAIVRLLLDKFQQQTGVGFIGDSVALSRVTEMAEKAKQALSERSSFDIHLPMLMFTDAGQPLELKCTIERAEIEAVCLGLVNRSLDVVRDVLLDGQTRPQEVDDVILVGGMTRMPLVREQLKEMFGKSPHASVHADEAVALGAALYSGSIDQVSSVVLIDVVPMTVGVGMAGGSFTRLIERNTPLPAQKSFAMPTTEDNQKVLEISLFQGEDSHISANEYLGTVRIEDLPRGPKGSVKVAVTVKLTSECVVEVEARELSTRKQVKATLATRYTPEEIQKQLGISLAEAKEAEARVRGRMEEKSGGIFGFFRRILRRK